MLQVSLSGGETGERSGEAGRRTLGSAAVVQPQVGCNDIYIYIYIHPLSIYKCPCPP